MVSQSSERSASYCIDRSVGSSGSLNHKNKLRSLKHSDLGQIVESGSRVSSETMATEWVFVLYTLPVTVNLFFPEGAQKLGL